MRFPGVASAALAAIVALLSTGIAPAQLGIGQVNGTVFGADRKGAPGLPIAVVPSDGRFLYGTSTDADGRYALKGMPPGTYTVMVGLPSGVVRKDGIRIRPLFRSIVDFTLGGDAPGATLPGLHASAGEAAPASGGAALAFPAGDGTVPAAPEASRTAAASPAGGSSGPGGPSSLPLAPAAASSGAPSAGAAPPATPVPSTAASGAADAAGTPVEPAPGIAMTWTLMGPEKTSAPDAWVAAIPVQGAGALRRGRTDATGGARLAQVPVGQYHLLVRAPGFMTWRMGPLPLDGTGTISLMMTLVPYPMGFPGTLEDLLIPADPIPLSAEQSRP